MGLQSTAMPGNVNGEISFQPIQGSLGQPSLAQSSPVQASPVQNGIVPAGVASPIQPQENLQGAYVGREDQLAPADSKRQALSERQSLFQIRSTRRRSSRHHRRHRQSRNRRHSVRDSGSSEELDIESVRLDPTQYLTRNYAFSDNTDNIPSSCLMMRKLPRVPCLVVLHVRFFILFDSFR